MFYHRITSIRTIEFQIVLHLNAMQFRNMENAYIAIFQAFKRQKCNEFGVNA